jgi:hypothetical protein
MNAGQFTIIGLVFVFLNTNSLLRRKETIFDSAAALSVHEKLYVHGVGSKRKTSS